MKIYTNTIDLANPSDKKFWVAPYSDFGIGIKFVANGEDVEGTVILKDRDGNEMTANEETYGDGFTVFKTTSGRGEKTDVYTAVAPNGQETIIIQNTSDSTVFDIDEAGAGVPDELQVDLVEIHNTNSKSEYPNRYGMFGTSPDDVVLTLGASGPSGEIETVISPDRIKTPSTETKSLVADNISVWDSYSESEDTHNSIFLSYDKYDPSVNGGSLEVTNSIQGDKIELTKSSRRFNGNTIVSEVFQRVTMTPDGITISNEDNGDTTTIEINRYGIDINGTLFEPKEITLADGSTMTVLGA